MAVIFYVGTGVIDLTFEWDPNKDGSIRRKHGVMFDEASSAFGDPNQIREYDEEHSTEEDRWLLIGLSSRLRLLAVIYTKRNENIRLISSRRANQAETRRYADKS